MKMETMGVYWEFEAPEATAIVDEHGHFDARGMRPVYGRGDHIGLGHTFNMNIWKDKQRRLFMRFWSRCSEIDWRSYEIKGLDVSSIPDRDKEHGFEDWWLPKAVRTAYELWIAEEW